MKNKSRCKNTILSFITILLVTFTGCSFGGSPSSQNASNTSCTVDSDCVAGQICQNGSCVNSSGSVPSAPTNLTATAGNQKVYLTWNASAGATSYNVYTATTSGGYSSAVGYTVATNYTVTRLTNGTVYYFIVTAVNANGESVHSNEVSATPVVITQTFYVGTNGVESEAIDNTGSIWVVSSPSGSPNGTVTKLNSTGVTLGTYNVGLNPRGGIAIDASGNVWVTNAGRCINTTEVDSVTELSSTGITLGTYNVGSCPEGIAIDPSGNVWVANNLSNNVTEINSSTGITINTYSAGTSPYNIIIDTVGNVWVGNVGSGNSITELDPTGNKKGTVSLGGEPSGIAVDNSGNIWVACKNGYLVELSATRTVLNSYNFNPTIYDPLELSIDVSGHLWMPNNFNNIFEVNSSGTIVNNYSISFGGSGVAAIDASGNMWIPGHNGNNLTEIVGIAQGPQYFPCQYSKNPSCPQWP